MLRAVTFDYWNTLVYEQRGHLRARRADAWAGILGEAGFAAEREAIGAVFDATWERAVERWVANDHLPSEQAAGIAVDLLGFEVPPEVREHLVKAFSTSGEDAELYLTPGIEETIGALRDAGLAIGIVCDVGFTPSRILRGFLERRGLLRLFDAWAFSDEVGVYKPSPVIFNHVLDRLGAPPARVAHVGDLRRTDVAGARAMGMMSVRYTGVWDDDTQTEPEAHHVIAHHRELPAIAGIG